MNKYEFTEFEIKDKTKKNFTFISIFIILIVSFFVKELNRPVLNKASRFLNTSYYHLDAVCIEEKDGVIKCFAFEKTFIANITITRDLELHGVNRLTVHLLREKVQ